MTYSFDLLISKEIDANKRNSKRAEANEIVPDNVYKDNGIRCRIDEEARG